MAGSYKHIINRDGEFTGTELIDNLGDAYEALEECYDMIQYLSVVIGRRYTMPGLMGTSGKRNPTDADAAMTCSWVMMRTEAGR